MNDENNIQEIEEAYITMPKGFKANGVSAGLKGNGALDLALVYTELPATVAGVYTSNLIKGHSLERSIKVIDSGKKLHGIVVNSKNANACVGNVGREDAATVAKAVADCLNVEEDTILTASTGVIGVRLPFEMIIAGVPSLVEGLSDSKEAAHNSERAIMTTDTRPKEVSAKIVLKDNTEVTISGMAKGAGMIHPNLATMISVFTTDVEISKDLLQKMLKEAVSHTFNRVTVDGDTSCCDMVTVFANGASGAVIEEGTDDAKLFQDALTGLSEDLSRMIASDGEGATKFVEVEVFGAKDEYDAKLVVSSVAKSPLCKTAFYGMDANFGRVITAAGYSGASFDPYKVDIDLGDFPVYRDGCALLFDEEEVLEILKQHDLNIKIYLHEGDAYDRMFTCDFSHDYVTINGSYRT